MIAAEGKSVIESIEPDDDRLPGVGLSRPMRCMRRNISGPEPIGQKFA